MSPAERPDPSPSLTISSSMSSYNCFRDGCDQNFGSQRAWSQHIRRKHNDDPGTTLLTQLVSDYQGRKRKRAEEEETQRVAKRRELEVLQEVLPPAEPMACPIFPKLRPKVLSKVSNRSLYSSSPST